MEFPTQLNIIIEMLTPLFKKINFICSMTNFSIVLAEQLPLDLGEPQLDVFGGAVELLLGGGLLQLASLQF